MKHKSHFFISHPHFSISFNSFRKMDSLYRSLLCTCVPFMLDLTNNCLWNTKTFFIPSLKTWCFCGASNCFELHGHEKNHINITGIAKEIIRGLVAHQNCLLCSKMLIFRATFWNDLVSFKTFVKKSKNICKKQR
jgi:hypothetical protein